MNNRFRRFSGVFTCKDCGKRTRDVNGMNGGLGLCELCQTQAQSGNSASDNGLLPDDVDSWDYFKKFKTVKACNAELERLWEEDAKKAGKK